MSDELFGKLIHGIFLAIPVGIMIWGKILDMKSKRDSDIEGKDKKKKRWRT